MDYGTVDPAYCTPGFTCGEHPSDTYCGKPTRPFAVGDFVSETLFTDTRVYVVVRKTAKTLTIAPTVDVPGKAWSDPYSDKGPYPVTLTAQQAQEGAKTLTVRLRQDGTYRTGNGAHALKPCRVHDGYAVSRTDYRV